MTYNATQCNFRSRRYEEWLERPRDSPGTRLSAGRPKCSAGYARLCRQLLVRPSEPPTGQRHATRSQRYVPYFFPSFSCSIYIQHHITISIYRAVYMYCILYIHSD